MAATLRVERPRPNRLARSRDGRGIVHLTAGEVHALIGPNGAGKSTHDRPAGGRARPFAGRISFDGADIDARSRGAPGAAWARAQFQQVTSILGGLSVEDNVAIADPRGRGPVMRCFAAARRDCRRARRWRGGCLEEVGLGRRAASGQALAYGTQRQLELGMALADPAKALLLDEPMAGMSIEETAAMIA